MSRLYLEGVEFASIDNLEKSSFENGRVPDYVTSINCPLSASEEVSFECEVNAQAFSKLMGVDLAKRGDLTSFTVECTTPYQVQIRRHRKKRINKKWAKRYGYKTMFKTVKMTDVQFVQNETDFEFVGRGIHVM
jgi:hypothetical protein